ncbi:unnamed protein product [Linum tenue]|uniref:Uncharacterized protein n=1 Tax=Linum tenue TaxID=586396 RepID=A0AAV0H4P4_9ROSI|nr:unnamed protein product [Linum tenue]
MKNLRTCRDCHSFMKHVSRKKSLFGTGTVSIISKTELVRVRIIGEGLMMLLRPSALARMDGTQSSHFHVKPPKETYKMFLLRRGWIFLQTRSWIISSHCIYTRSILILIDMRLASVNHECYAQSAIKNGLQKHILRASQNCTWT